MTTITDHSQKDLPQNLRDLLDGKHDGRALDGKSLAQDVRDLDAAKARVKALMYIEGHVNGAVLYSMAADEIESLRARMAMLADWIIQHGEDGDGDEVENAIRLMELQLRKLDAVPVDAIRAVLVEWAAHGMRMTDSTTAVIEWLGSLDGDA